MRYKYNPETKEVEPYGGPLEQIHTDIVYGREQLDYMRKNGVVPTSDFKDFWAKKEAERVASKLPAGTEAWKRERKETIIEAVKRVEAGYRPNIRKLED
jgi:hypothetical protein